MMLELYNRQKKKIAILENAFNIVETPKLNSLDLLSFSLPADDKKTELCQPFYFVRIDRERFYRIMPTAENYGETPTISIECESAIATLIDDVMLGWHQIGNMGVYTTEVLQYVLNFQTVQHWQLGEVDFARQFEYGWQDENLYGALLSVASPITDAYRFTFDYTTTPWTVSLKAIDVVQKPSVFVFEGHNLLSMERTSDPQQIYTRICPRGYGEGVNQLDIKAINGGSPYLTAPQSLVDKYGLKTLVWSDRRYESAETLKAMAQKLLDAYSVPYVEYSVSILPDDNVGISQKIRVKTSKGRFDFMVTEIQRSYGEIPTMTVKIANKPQDLASTISDIANRQRIESTYAQGATQLYSHSTQANADSTQGAEINFYIPHETRVINKVNARIKLSPFRAYSSATSTKDADSTTSQSGGGTSTSTSTKSASYPSTDSGGGATRTTTATELPSRNMEDDDDGGSNANNHNHGISRSEKLALYSPQEPYVAGYVVWTPSGAHGHGDHDHEVNIPSHKHDFTIPSHNHSVTFPTHTHGFTTPAHSHTITPAIYRFGNPTSFTAQINGTAVGVYDSRQAEIDLTALLADPETHEIARGRWYEIKIIPNDKAYVQADIFIQSFIQSIGGGTY